MKLANKKGKISYHYSGQNVQVDVWLKLTDRLPNMEVRNRLGLEDSVTVLQHSRLWYYDPVSQKNDNEWVSRCRDYEGEVVYC